MADAIDQATDDTGLSDGADTSNAGDDAFDLEDTDISWEDGEKVDEPEAETEDEAATESEEEAESEQQDDVSTEEETSDEETETSEDTETPKAEDTTAEERKKHNAEMAAARVEAQRAKQEAETLRKQAEEDKLAQFLREAGDDEDELERRQTQVEKYRNQQERIDLNSARLETDIARAAADIDLFKTGTPAVKERLLRALDQFEANNVTKDERGRPVEIRGNVYQYLQDEADSIRSLLGDGAKQQTQAKTRQTKRTLQTPARTPRQPKVDPDLADFLSEAKSW